MPELPEVETARRGLEPILKGQRFINIIVNRSHLRYPLPTNLKNILNQQQIIDVRRRAKYLLIDFENAYTLIVHFGMSGRILIIKSDLEYKINKHDHIIFETSQGFRIVYNDPRRFGFMLLYSKTELKTVSHFKNIGFEPFDYKNLNAKILKEFLSKYSLDIKSVLLNQKIIVGVGNIYASESLWQAGLSPLRQSNTINLDECSRLLEAIRDVLNRAINAGGSTLRDYRQTDDEPGYFQHLFKVYNRNQQPCYKCHTTNLSKIFQKGRSTYYCSQCQV